MHLQWLQIVYKSLQRGVAVGHSCLSSICLTNLHLLWQMGQGQAFLEHDLSTSRLYNCQRAPWHNTGLCQQVLSQVTLEYSLRIAQDRSLIFQNMDIYFLTTQMLAENTTGAILAAQQCRHPCLRAQAHT